MRSFTSHKPTKRTAPWATLVALAASALIAASGASAKTLV